MGWREPLRTQFVTVSTLELVGSELVVLYGKWKKKRLRGKAYRTYCKALLGLSWLMSGTSRLSLPVILYFLRGGLLGDGFSL